MQRAGMPLLIHGEVTDAAVDIFDREAVFIDRALTGLVRDFPELRRSEEHTSELQSLMRISYAVFCLKKKNHNAVPKNYTHICNPTATRIALHRIADVQLR